MHYFISAGEPSGDLHGSNLVKALRKADPSARFSGFGGDKMSAAGCKLLYPLCNHPVMGLMAVFLHLFTFMRLARRARLFFRNEKPDALILIDYPGFHWHLAKRAKWEGVPVFYFVPPQLWAWAGWRVRKMRRNVDCVLSALPFEHDWFKARGVDSIYIGHPYFDELGERTLDLGFMESQAGKPGRMIALLPGSRTAEVNRNCADMLDAACRVYRRFPETRFVVAAYKESQAALVRERIISRDVPVEVHVGRTSEIIAGCEVALSVSGSVSLELMYRLKPTAIVYRSSHLMKFFVKLLVKIKYATLVNLLADEAVYPEFLGTDSKAVAIADQLGIWLGDLNAAGVCVRKLEKILADVAEPGACERAAAILRERLQTPMTLRRAA